MRQINYHKKYHTCQIDPEIALIISSNVASVDSAVESRDYSKLPLF